MRLMFYVKFYAVVCSAIYSAFSVLSQCLLFQIYIDASASFFQNAIDLDISGERSAPSN